MRCLQVFIVASTVGLCCGTSAVAANIVWVTPHSPGVSTAAANLGFTEPPDVGYTNLLSGAGHSVTRFLVPATGANVALTPDALSILNAADLVIIGRSSNSGSFDNAAEITSWNTDVTAPLILTAGYIARSNRLGFTTGTTIPDITGATRFAAPNPAHPVFDGVTLNAGNETGEILNLVTAPIAGNPVQRGTSINNNTIVAGGTLIASITADGSVPDGPTIAEFPAGTASSNGGSLFGNKRMLFTTGSREVSGASSETAGILDLSADGRTMFLNAVCYMAVGGCSPIVPGDTDGDLVGGEFPDDFDPIKMNFRKMVSSRSQGDLVADGVVDFKDFRQWKTAHLGGGSLAGIDLSFLANVPEPGTAVLLLIGAAAIAAGRRRAPSSRNAKTDVISGCRRISPALSRSTET